MLLKFALNLVIGFVLRQVAKWQEGVDFSKVKADLDERVKALVPGAFFDDEAIYLVNNAIDVIAAILANTTELKVILDLVAGGDFKGGFDVLWKLLVGKVAPQAVALSFDEQHEAVVNALKAV